MHSGRTIKLVDVDAAGGVEPRRLLRALTLIVHRTSRGRYLVMGGTEPHHVDLIDPMMERCDCGDFLWRQTVCQHLLACLLREGDERVVSAAGRLIQALAAENAHLRKRLRGRTIVLTRALKRRVAETAGVPVCDLDFHRDRDGDSTDVEVVHCVTGEVVGRLTRRISRPEFDPVPGPPEQPRRAA